MHEVLVNSLGGLSLPRKSVVRLTDRPDMTLDVYRGRKTTIQPTNIHSVCGLVVILHSMYGLVVSLYFYIWSGGHLIFSCVAWWLSYINGHPTVTFVKC